MPTTPHIESLKTSLDHVASTLNELRMEHKATQMDVVAIKVSVAGMKASTGERSKVGDWILTAIISGLTATGITGLAKAVMGGPVGK